jgi:hypothetical protein
MTVSLQGPFLARLHNFLNSADREQAPAAGRAQLFQAGHWWVSCLQSLVDHLRLAARNVLPPCEHFSTCPTPM